MGNRRSEITNPGLPSPLRSLHSRPSLVSDASLQVPHSRPTSQNINDSNISFVNSEKIFSNSQDEPVLSSRSIRSEHDFLHIPTEFQRRSSIITSVVERPSSEQEDRLSVNRHERFYLQPKQFQRKPNWKRWKRPLKHFSIFFSLCLAVWFYVPFPLFIAPNKHDTLNFTPEPWSCNNIGFAGGGPWNLIGIDVRFGRMTFGQAKGLDLAWNWIAGRGLQLILTLVAYRVFTGALMRTAEVTYVPYELFTSLALFSTKTDTLWHLTQGFKALPGWRFKFTVGWLLFSTGYLSIFPSLMDVISGYEAAYVSVLILPNKTTLTLDGLRTFEGLLYYVVCDGQDKDPSSCEDYHYQFFDNTLNESYSATQHWVEIPRDTPRPLFYAEVPENFNCVAEKNIYEWGFSSEWVLIAGCLNSFWLFGLWILWLDADTQSQFCKKGRQMGTYRAIVDIAEVIREDLGENLAAYSEKELVAALRQQSKIKYYVTEPRDGSLAHVGLSSRQSDRIQLSWDLSYQ